MLRHRTGIGVGAADQRGDAFAGCGTIGPRAQRSEASGAGRFGDDPQFVPQRALRVADGVVGNQHRVTDQGAGDFEVGRADATGAQRIGGDAGDRDVDRLPGLQRLVQRGRAFGLDGDDLLRRAERGGAAGDQAAAADGDQQRVELSLLGEFERDAARASA